jgi:hypothetical protein
MADGNQGGRDMKRKFTISGMVAVVLIIGAVGPIFAQEPEQKPLPTENFYNKSLHYTNKGIAYMYSKESGGLETITGIPGSEIGCDKPECHARSCDVCHAVEANGKMSYTLDPARSAEACARCHPVEKDDPDVHFKQGMKCMDCHTVREIHGDGTEYNSFNQPGAMDADCETCHNNISQIPSHTVHKGKLDCPTCHVLQSTTCYNCHIDARLAKIKGASMQLKNVLFLVNHEDKVTLGNFLSYVYHDKSMITLAPSFAHSIKKDGLKCPDCHDTKIVREIAKDKFKLVTWNEKKQALANAQGVVPALDGMTWRIVPLSYDGKTWTAIAKPEKTIIHYAGYCTPLTADQFAKLIVPQGRK